MKINLINLGLGVGRHRFRPEPRPVRDWLLLLLLAALILTGTLGWRFYAFRRLENHFLERSAEQRLTAAGLKTDQINRLVKIIRIRAQYYELIKAGRPKVADPAR